MKADALRKTPTEKQFLAQVLDYARLRGWLCYHTFDSRKSAAGFPDLLLARGERLIAAELKVGKNKPTAAQQEWITALTRAGVAVYVWYPTDEHWRTIEEVLGA